MSALLKMQNEPNIITIITDTVNLLMLSITKPVHTCNMLTTSVIEMLVHIEWAFQGKC